jgi:HPt (histidine-containing phosphotransfer) domain-containing protein
MMAMEGGTASKVAPMMASPAVSGYGSRPVDLVFLARQTFGDRQVETEVLRLFLAQAPKLVDQIDAASGEERVRAAHRLVGAARAIGARDVAEAAGALEIDAGRDIQSLLRSVEAATVFISSLLDGAPRAQ